MPQTDTVTRLLFVEDRADDAEQLISLLRNGGMAVRPLRPESVDELARQLLEQPVDLVLAAWDGRQIPFSTVMQVVDASGKDVPVLASIEHVDEAVLLDSLSTGARHVALRGRPEQLLQVVRQAVDERRLRRGVRHLEIALRESERRCDALIASSRDPIAYVHEGMHIRANEAYLEMFGYADFEEVEGLPLLDAIAPSHADGFKQLLKRLSRGEPPPRSAEVVAQRADGSSFDAVIEFAQASYEGEACLQIVFRQQAVDPDVARELDALRQRDQVTGLFNRSHFLSLLEDAVARAADGEDEQVLLLVEPDHYAAALSDIGLAHADALLAGLGARLQSALGEHDFAARFTDHGFVVLGTQSDHRRSAELAEGLRSAFSGHIVEAGNRSLTLTASVAGVQISERIATVQQVLAQATRSLQSAVAAGGDRVEIHDPGAVDRAEEERVRAWVQRLRTALAGDGFVLHYQPIVHLQGDPAETYQVRLQLASASGELVDPDNFLGIAEAHGLLEEIDRWAIAHAVAAAAALKERRRRPTLFIGITQASIDDESLPGFVRETLAAHGVDGSQLVFELTEAKAFTSLRASQQFQAAISALGCRICLEQFGAGLNSFHLLNHLDPTYLRIDPGFMQDLPRNAEHQAKLREIAAQARDAGKRTIAEAVEDAASMAALFSGGIDYVQGHFLAPPGPVMNHDFG